MRKPEPKPVFVYADSDEYSDVAAYLLAIASERGFDPSVVKTTFQGFLVPAGMLQEGEYTEVPDGVKDVTKDAPDWFFEEPKKVDVLQDEKGAIYVKEDVAEALAKELGTSVEEINEQFDLDALKSKDPDPHQPATGVDDREVIREWAKENGFEPAEKGALKKAVIDAYNDAHK